MTAIWGRWIDVLVGILFAWREMWRARRVLIVSYQNDQLIVRQTESGPDRFMSKALSQRREAISSILRNFVSRCARKPDGVSIPDDLRRSPPGPGEDGLEELPAGSVVGHLPRGTPVSDEVARAARCGFVTLELSADKVVVRRMSVPAQAGKFLPGIVRNQLERLSPWQADQAAYGFDAEVSGEDATALEVRVFVTSRNILDSARDELAAMGLRVDRIVAREGGTQAAAPVPLWSRLTDLPRESVGRARRQIGTGILAVVCLSIGFSLWALSSAASFRGESEDLTNRSRTLQSQLQGSRIGTESLIPAERAWHLKKTSVSAVIVLEVLSRALPDTAYLTELRLDNRTLRIIGLSNDAPGLIAPLERSGDFSEVRFFAPTTRSSDGALFRFNIEARVKPRLDITE